jgi:cytochrome c556
MIRVILVVAVLGGDIAFAAAQSDLVRQRSDLMSEQGKHFHQLNRMLRREEPYDQAKVDAAFAKLAEISRKLPALYPKTARGEAPDANYYASSKVWKDKADFDARFAKLGKDIDESAPRAKSFDGLKDAYAAIVQTCNGCHEVYRVKRN